MDGLDIFALIVLLVISGSAILVVVVLGGLPGKIARGRNHPQADAIAVCGWLGLVTGILWALALVWAFLRPPRSELAELKQTVKQLEERVAMLSGEAANLTPAGGPRS